MYENADFSPETIKSSIKEGEAKTNELLKNDEACYRNLSFNGVFMSLKDQNGTSL